MLKVHRGYYWLGFLLLLLFVCTPATRAQNQQGTGAIQGRIEVKTGGSAIGTGGGLGNPYQRRSRSSASTASTSMNKVIVWITAQHTPSHDLREDPISLNQQDQQFVPQLLPVVEGETVRIMNSDPVYHNVFSLSPVKRFDVGRRPKGDFKDITFSGSGIVDVFCDIHSNMHAMVVVMARSTYVWQIVPSGQPFTFELLPPGTYQLHAVTKGVKPLVQTIEVRPNSVQDASTLQLSR
jgi:plastocyanin